MHYRRSCALSILIFKYSKISIGKTESLCYNIDTEVYDMISYKPLWHTLLSKDMKKMDLVNRGIVARSTLAKMGKDEYVALEVLDRICSKLGCPIEAVVEIKPAAGL